MEPPSTLGDHVAQRPIRVAVANDYPIVVAGIARALEPYATQVEVVELDSGTVVSRNVDVVLLDTFAREPGLARRWADVLGRTSARLVIFSWRTDPQMVADSLRSGAAGVVSKTTTAEDLVEAIERAHRGVRLRPPLHPRGDQPDLVAGGGRIAGWPGESTGLTARESEVLALICRGLSNEEISAQAYIGINTVKTYIRSAYRKIDATSRSQAVIWGLTHGFERVEARTYPD